MASSRYVLGRGVPGFWETRGVRRLVVVRHAKARRDSARGDHGRELSTRGRAQASLLRTWTERGRPLGDLRGTAVVSDAARTLETFELGLAGSPVCARGVVDPALYNGVRDVTTRDVLSALVAADPGYGDLFVVCHNPTVSYLVADLAAPSAAADAALRGGFAMCGVAVLAYDDDVPALGSCDLEFYGAPGLEGREP
jgi:phosphohistidine phosphatase